MTSATMLNCTSDCIRPSCAARPCASFSSGAFLVLRDMRIQRAHTRPRPDSSCSQRRRGTLRPSRRLHASENSQTSTTKSHNHRNFCVVLQFQERFGVGFSSPSLNKRNAVTPSHVHVQRAASESYYIQLCAGTQLLTRARQDTIKVEPVDFGKKAEDALREEIERRYANKVSPAHWSE